MFVSKLLLIALWWKLSLAAEVTEAADNCVAEVDESTGGNVALQLSGKPAGVHSGKPAGVHAQPAQITEPCNWVCYFKRYTDLQDVLGKDNYAAAEAHYKIYGRPEGRDCKCKPGDPDEMPKNKDGRCLKFLHIPKNAGATVEEIRDVQMAKVQARYGIAGFLDQGYGMGETILRYLNCTEGEQQPTNKCTVTDESGNSGLCSAFHTPPDYDSKIADGYQGCDTFCIVRHPLARALSQHISTGGACTADAFTKHLDLMSKHLPDNPFADDCHWVSQTKYTKHCQRVLRFENLEEDFDSLMAEYGYRLTLGDHHVAHHNTSCDLAQQPDNLPEQIWQWLEQYYAADFAEYGFNRDNVK